MLQDVLTVTGIPANATAVLMGCGAQIVLRTVTVNVYKELAETQMGHATLVIEVNGAIDVNILATQHAHLAVNVPVYVVGASMAITAHTVNDPARLIVKMDANNRQEHVVFAKTVSMVSAVNTCVNVTLPDPVIDIEGTVRIVRWVPGTYTVTKNV